MVKPSTLSLKIQVELGYDNILELVCGGAGWLNANVSLHFKFWTIYLRFETLEIKGINETWTVQQMKKLQALQARLQNPLQKYIENQVSLCLPVRLPAEP